MATLKASSKTFNVPSGQTVERTARCDKGKALSGGFIAPLPGGGGPAMIPLDSTREGSDGWRLRARNNGQAGNATAFVYCRKGTPNLTTASAQAMVADDSQQAIAAQCPPGSEAVAGGFDFPDGSTNLLSSRRTGSRTWEVTPRNVTGAPQLYTVFAYCDSSEPGLRTRSKTVTTDPTERFSQSATAKCKRSQELRSGGFEIERFLAPSPENNRIGFVHGSRRRGERSWKATAFAALGDPELTAYAYCN